MNDAQLFIQNKRLYAPVSVGEIEWNTERSGSPGKLTFTILRENKLQFLEGNSVWLFVGGKSVFTGYLFSQSRDQGVEIKWTAYDQIRYLQNKDTILYKNKTASELIKMISGITKCALGNIENTKHVIDKKLEDDVSYLDMILNALDVTLISKKKMYVLYDQAGKLQLQDIEKMTLDLLIDEQTGESYSYSSSIDSETYNKIKLVYENEESGTWDVISVKDETNISKWGLLQYFEKIDSVIGAKEKANNLLSLYNRKVKNLSISGVLGDIRARAGASVIVSLNLGDSKLMNYMIIEKAKHVFEGNLHTMDLTLRGGDFIA